MKRRCPAERLVRWYPPAWRERYGDELVALLEDCYGDDGVPWRRCPGLVKAAAIERAREADVIGAPADVRSATRAGSLVVLCAWAVFMVAGAAFAKYAEHWEAVTPVAARHLPAVAFGAVQVAAFAGILIVALAAVVAIPGFIHLVRAGGLGPIRAPLRRALVVTAVTAAGSVGLIAWAHHLGPSQRNGGLWPYQVVGMAWAVLVVASIALCTAAVVAAGSRIELSDRMERLYRALAVALSVAMAVILGGVIVWWAALTSSAPWFLHSGLLAVRGGPVSTPMVGTALLMAVGLVIAVLGTGRALHPRGVAPPD